MPREKAVVEQPSVAGENKILAKVQSPPQLIVGLGASAGGLRALEAFFHEMPVSSGCSFVVVQHLSPDFKSLMDDLLGRQTTMRIHRVEEGMTLERDSIYLIPPKKLMTVEGGRLMLTDRLADRPSDLPINVFLKSLAADAGSRAVAVVLSGSGTDGSEGVRAVHAAGGLVLVQSLDSAEFDGMPRSAIATSMADYVLAPAEMPKAIQAYIEDPDTRLEIGQDGDEAVVSPDGKEPSEFTSIFTLLRHAFGLDFTHYKTATVERRIHRRMALRNLQEAARYAEHLENNHEELDLLYRDLLIGVTEFFRDPAAFVAAREQIYDKLLAAPSREELRVWVAGCASGEEAYSHAILIDECAREHNYTGRISIFATDVHRSSIEVASSGLYPRASLTHLSEERITRYFRQEKNGLMRINGDIRQRIVFAPHNLLNDPPFTKVDVISCRNLLIYLEPGAQERVIGLFHYALRREGVLFLGSSEGLGRLDQDFATLDPRHKFFRKTRDSRLPLAFRQPAKITRTALPATLGLTSAAATSQQVLTLLQAYDRLLQKHLPPGFILTESGEILHYNGNAADFLTAASGRAQENLFNRTSGDLRLAVTTLIPKVLRTRSPAWTHGVRLEPAQGDGVVADLLATPMADEKSGQVLLHLSFQNLRSRLEQLEPAAPVSAAPQTHEKFETGQAQAHRIADLELELQSTKENLQATVEELQTSNEELQAANEEMLAANEELQSTNEELHSVNEELYTVNSEFEHKNHELKSLNEDLDNLLAATATGTLFLDRDLRIRKFNPAIEQIFHLLPQDVGRPIEHIAYHLDDQAAMVEQIRTVLATGQPVERELRTHTGRWLLKRVLPFYATHRAVEGVVLTFTDISLIKSVQSKLDLAMVSSRLVWWEWSLANDRLNTHANGWCILGYEIGSLIPSAQTWYSLTHPDDLPMVKATLNDTLQGHTDEWECEHRLKDRAGEWRWVLNKGRVTERNSAGHPLTMLGTTQDVHHRHHMETQVRLLSHAIAQANLSVVITDAQGGIEYVNPFFTQITGYTAEEVIGKNPRLLKSERTPASLHADLWATISRGDVWRGEMINRRKDGAEYCERLAVNPVRDPHGEITHFVAVKEDVTNEKQQAEARAKLETQLAEAKKMETLGTLAGGIAHDFNNLLTAILGYNRFAIDDVKAGGKPDEALHQVEVAARRAADLVSRILSFSRQESDALLPLQLGRVCEDTLAMFRSTLPPGVDLLYQDDSRGGKIEGDSTRIQQALLNLCHNAVESMGKAGGRLNLRVQGVSLAESASDVQVGRLYAGDYLRIEIEDTGCGMDEATLARIFEPFFTTKSAAQGAGLGLSIVHTTALTHHGAIRVSSQLGKGTKFELYFPVTTVEVSAPATDKHSAPLRGFGEKVALIDDERSIAELNRVMLSRFGYKPQILPNAFACQHAFQADPQAFDIIVTDQTMPGMTGLELAGALRQQGVEVPVLILSGYTNVLSPADIKALGSSAFLQKPYVFEDVLQAMRGLIKKKTATT